MEVAIQVLHEGPDPEIVLQSWVGNVETFSSLGKNLDSIEARYTVGIRGSQGSREEFVGWDAPEWCDERCEDIAALVKDDRVFQSLEMLEGLEERLRREGLSFTLK